MNNWLKSDEFRYIFIYEQRIPNTFVSIFCEIKRRAKRI
jgi:hypothetical protein